MTTRVFRRIIDRVDLRDDAGFTLLEVIVSFVLFVVISTFTLYSVTNALQASHHSQQRVDAANVAQYWVAQARASANTITPDPGSSHVVTIGNNNGPASREQFTVKRWVVFSAPNATECSPGTTYTVNIEVYQGTSSTFLARSDSVVACPPA